MAPNGPLTAPTAPDGPDGPGGPPTAPDVFLIALLRPRRSLHKKSRYFYKINFFLYIFTNLIQFTILAGENFIWAVGPGRPRYGPDGPDVPQRPLNGPRRPYINVMFFYVTYMSFILYLIFPRFFCRYLKGTIGIFHAKKFKKNEY